MPGLGITLGRGGATTFQQDLQNSDVILIQGSNMAECHPVGFQWVMEAKARGATIIHVDPRYTRTSAMADLHVPIRAGSDIVFLGALVNHVLENERYFKEYVVHYTNAASILREDFKDTEELGGLFSGWDAKKGEYDTRTWQYYGSDGEVPAGGHKEVFPVGEDVRVRGKNVKWLPRDETLQHPRCVFQVLKRHFVRYTPAMVEEVCGISREQFAQVAKALCDNSGPERTGAFCYAVGWTQHSVGVQYIRTAAILQLLLGNIGRPGGGIMALRGHASIQGSTDIPTLFDLLPGYLPMVHANHGKFEEYWKTNTAPVGFWHNFQSYFVSLMKAWFGEAANKSNDWMFDSLPRTTGNHSHLVTVAEMADGKVRGYFVMGENPAVGSSHAVLQRKALRKLKWLVVRDFALTETAEFWRTAPEITSGEISPEEIDTEVFFFPAAAHTEKDGSFTNTQRLLQWHHKAIEPPGDCRSELHFTWHLGRILKELYQGSTATRDKALQAMTWDYPLGGQRGDEPQAEAVLKEIGGYTIADGKPLPGYLPLKADGSTACGCWIYAGAYKDGINQTARRKPGREQTIVAPEWGWAWPMNRRLLYNRASADPSGKPWSERKKYVYWSAAQKKWVGPDVPDFVPDKAPDYRPPKGAEGPDALAGDDPFVMQADGKAWLFAPSGLVDGPMPAHYEPEESVVANALYPQQCNPRRIEWNRRDNQFARAYGDPRFPYLLTTYRLTEHHTAGGMSRWLSWLAELQPEMFCEVSPELARRQGLRHGGWATVRTARGDIECRVLVTERMKPLRIRGRLIHQIGLPYHWSYTGRVRGGSTNDLIGLVADPNVNIQESKAFTGDIVPGRVGHHHPGRGRRTRLEAGSAAPSRDNGPIRPSKPEPSQHERKEE